MDLNKALTQLLKDADWWLKQSSKSSLIDFDLTVGCGLANAESLGDLLNRLNRILHNASGAGNLRYLMRLRALDIFLRCHSGQRLSFDKQLLLVQGAERLPVLDAELQHTEADLRNLLTHHGFEWDDEVNSRLREKHGVIASANVLTSFQDTLRVVIGPMETWLNRALPINVVFRLVDTEAYWNYWVSGDSAQFSVAINQRKDEFTRAEVIMAVMHELVCHCGQLTSWKQRAISGSLDSSFLITSVNSPEQFGLEGIAQTILWFVNRDTILGSYVDPDLIEIDMALYHYRELVMQRAFDSLLEGQPVDYVIGEVRSACPWIRENAILRDLRTLSSGELSSYRYIYPVSFRKFIAIAKANSHENRRALVAKLFDDVFYLGNQDEFERWQRV